MFECDVQTSFVLESSQDLPKEVVLQSDKARYMSDLVALDFFIRFLTVLTEFSTLPLLCG